MCRNGKSQYRQCLDNQNWTATHYTVVDSDSSYEDSLGYTCSGYPSHQ